MNEDVARGILGLESGATREEIKKAYAQRARFMHPDRFIDRSQSEIDHATSEFQRLGVARDFLLAGAFESSARTRTTSNGPSQEREPTPRKGRHFHTSIEVNERELVPGAVLLVSGPHGSPVKVRVPTSFLAGSTLRVKNQGWPGVSGGAAGDLYVKITVRDSGPASEPSRGTGHSASGTQHPDHLRAEMVLTLTSKKAAVGKRLTVTSPLGETFIIQVPAGMQQGGTLRIQGRGHRSEVGPERGDLILQLKIVDQELQTGFRAWPWVAGVAVLVLVLIAVQSWRSASEDDGASSTASVQASDADSPLAFTYQAKPTDLCSDDEGYGCWIWDVTPKASCARAEFEIEFFGSEASVTALDKVTYVTSGIVDMEAFTIEITATSEHPDFAGIGWATCTA